MPPGQAKGFSHQAFTTVLKAAVSEEGVVDYAGLRADPGPLDHYLGQLAATSPASAPHRFKSEDDRLAYYLNAYNAFILATVRENCPLQDIRSIYLGSGVFWRVSFELGGEPVTLSDLESIHLRGARGSDVEAHFALVKGGKGFPALPRTAYEGADVRERVRGLAQRLANDPRFVERKGAMLEASELFQQYQLDLGGGVLEWLKRVAPDHAKDNPKVHYRPLDWALNGAC